MKVDTDNFVVYADPSGIANVYSRNASLEKCPVDYEAFTRDIEGAHTPDEKDDVIRKYFGERLEAKKAKEAEVVQ